MNMRMNELTGAVALAQARKIDFIISVLREKKAKLKSYLSDMEGEKFVFRRLNDARGECSTLLTLIFKDKGTAANFVSKTGQSTISDSGWHVYNNMEQILGKKMASAYNCPFGCQAFERELDYKPHMLEKTDSILERAVNISVGVVDKGLGAGYGININSSNEEIKSVAERIRNIILNEI